MGWVLPNYVFSKSFNILSSFVEDHRHYIRYIERQLRLFLTLPSYKPNYRISRTGRGRTFVVLSRSNILLLLFGGNNFPSVLGFGKSWLCVYMSQDFHQMYARQKPHAGLYGFLLVSGTHKQVQLIRQMGNSLPLLYNISVLCDFGLIAAILLTF